MNALRSLTDNWDGEGAPRPCAEAIDHASAILEALCTTDVEIDADVLGGVSLTIVANGRRAWISCMNNGLDTVVFTDGDAITHAPWGDAVLERVAVFLSGGEAISDKPADR